MSGGGGGGYYVPPIRKKVTVACELLVVETVLVQPDAEVLSTLKIGNILTININGGRIEAQYGEDVVGGVQTPENKRIIECMEAGTVYVADIKSIEGEKCKVKIHALQL